MKNARRRDGFGDDAFMAYSLGGSAKVAIAEGDSSSAYFFGRCAARRALKIVGRDVERQEYGAISAR